MAQQILVPCSLRASIVGTGMREYELDALVEEARQEVWEERQACKVS